MSLVQDIVKAVLGREDEDAIPVMDGVMTPNSHLDEAEPIGAPLEGAEDFHFTEDGKVLVAAGNGIVRFSLSKPGQRKAVETLPDRLGAILPLEDGRIVAGVSGQGLFVVADGKSALVNADFTCPTALAPTASGEVLVTNGSSEHGLSDWAFDLMRHGASGSLASVNLDTGGARMLRDRLRWPAGVVEAANGDILYSESWAHSVSAHRKEAKAPAPVQRNLIGYPSRISPCEDGGYLLSIFSLCTQLVELVLREDDFRNEMIATIDPAYWIVPAYASDGDYREPLQGGSIKKLGIQKPWAPPRAYGLVVKLDARGEIQASHHSRVGGQWHGISAARATTLAPVSAATGIVVISVKEKFAARLIKSFSMAR